MWVTKINNKNGSTSYKYSERYTDELTGKSKIVSISLNSNTRQAVKQATNLLSEKIKSKKPSCEQITFERAGTEYLEYKAPSVKPTTRHNDKGNLNRLINALPKNILVNNLKLHIIQSVVNDMQKNGLKRAYISKHVHLFKAIIKHAKKLGFTQNVAYLDDIEVLRQVATEEDIKKKRNKFLSTEELHQVLAELKSIHPRIGLAVEFLSLTGLRFGELAALRYQDFDGEKININGTILPHKKNGDPEQRGTPKTASSYRDVLLDSRAIEIINYFIADNARRKNWWMSYEDRGYIFTSNRGNPFNLQEVNRYLRTIESPIKLSTHVFRHTHISILLANGVPIKTVMDRVGHTSMKTTMEIYTHVTKSQQAEAVKVLSNLKVAK